MIVVSTGYFQMILLITTTSCVFWSDFLNAQKQSNCRHTIDAYDDEMSGAVGSRVYVVEVRILRNWTRSTKFLTWVVVARYRTGAAPDNKDLLRSEAHVFQLVSIRMFATSHLYESLFAYRVLRQSYPQGQSESKQHWLVLSNLLLERERVEFIRIAIALAESAKILACQSTERSCFVVN